MKAANFLYQYRDKENRMKTRNLKSFRFQPYLKCEDLSTKEKKLLFSLRCRTVDVKTNYRNKFKFNMFCRICDNKTDEESENHLLKCQTILNHIDGNIDISNARYEHIFSENLDEQVSITKVFQSILKIRFKILSKTSI